MQNHLDLIQQIAKGNQQAFKEIYDIFLWRFLSKRYNLCCNVRRLICVKNWTVLIQTKGNKIVCRLMKRHKLFMIFWRERFIFHRCGKACCPFLWWQIKLGQPQGIAPTSSDYATIPLPSGLA